MDKTLICEGTKKSMLPDDVITYMVEHNMELNAANANYVDRLLHS